MLPRSTVELARFLIGAILVRNCASGRLAGKIVETEAYLGDDPASHSFRGRTARNGSMFLERGFAYVYLTYGLHYCMNVTSARAGEGEAVLVRAVEPLEGMESMRGRRGLESASPTTSLASGPAKLTQAFAIDRALDGTDLCRIGPLWLAQGLPPGSIGTSARIGISAATDLPLRFYEAGSRFLSGPRRLSP